MKLFSPPVLWAVLAFSFLGGGPGWAQTQTAEGAFTSEGTVTRIDLGEKIIRVKLHAGLEVTFRVDEATVFTQGAQAQTLRELAVQNNVVVEYVYTDNYEKLARAVTILPEKTEPPAT